MINRLKSWLADDTPRVIMIDKTFNFLGSEGTVTEMGCRLKDSCTAANGGQDTIKTSGCDANETPVQVKYDKASYLGMDVGSNKSLVGVGDKGLLLGKGLRFKAGAKNVYVAPEKPSWLSLVLSKTNKVLVSFRTSTLT